jgi:hypothetical protein
VVKNMNNPKAVGRKNKRAEQKLRK